MLSVSFFIVVMSVVMLNVVILRVLAPISRLKFKSKHLFSAINEQLYPEVVMPSSNYLKLIETSI